jgi:chaperone modulatory protein CbpM
MARETEILRGVILDETTWVDAGEVCTLCRVSRTHLVELVEEGVVEPVGGDPGDWRFPSSDLARLRRALRLERDLGVNPAGIALVMDLLDELERLRTRLNRLEGGF